MRMNGLDVKMYWVNLMIYTFVVSTLTSILLYVFGNFIMDLSFFNTSITCFIPLSFSWTISMLAMTSLLSLFISSSKSASIIGYLVSIMSTILGLVLCTAVYPFPTEMPNWMIIYPPFALCRAVYLIGFACADISGCYQNFYGSHF